MVTLLFMAITNIKNRKIMKNVKREIKRGDYLAEKEKMRKPVSKAMVVLIFLIIIFISVILRLATRT